MAEIPGFYYDETRKRYFRGQEPVKTKRPRIQDTNMSRNHLLMYNELNQTSNIPVARISEKWHKISQRDMAEYPCSLRNPSVVSESLVAVTTSDLGILILGLDDFKMHINLEGICGQFALTSVQRAGSSITDIYVAELSGDGREKKLFWAEFDYHDRRIESTHIVHFETISGVLAKQNTLHICASTSSRDPLAVLRSRGAKHVYQDIKGSFSENLLTICYDKLNGIEYTIKGKTLLCFRESQLPHMIPEANHVFQRDLVDTVRNAFPHGVQRLYALGDFCLLVFDHRSMPYVWAKNDPECKTYEFLESLQVQNRSPRSFAFNRNTNTFIIGVHQQKCAYVLVYNVWKTHPIAKIELECSQQYNPRYDISTLCWLTDTRFAVVFNNKLMIYGT